MKGVYRFRVLKVGKRDLYRGKAVYLVRNLKQYVLLFHPYLLDHLRGTFEMFTRGIFSLQCNHRSWADFMVDQYVTEGRTLFMSRWAVAYVFPLFMIPMWFVRAVLIFRRGSISNKKKFNQWIDREWAKSTQTALGVYPEGHRSTTGKSLPLKRGMLHYAYDRQIPVQIVIGGNKEAILSEKEFVVGFGQTVTVGYSDVIYPEKFDNFEDFMTSVQGTWDKEWAEVFTADWNDLQELPDPKPFRHVPWSNALKLLLICPIEIAILVGLLWGMFLPLKTLYMRVGPPFNIGALLLMVIYLCISFALAWRTNLTQVHKMKKFT